MEIGFVTGFFGLFHFGHLNLLYNVKVLCDKLIVSVYTDDLVGYKQKKQFIPFEERIEIIQSIRYVDEAVPKNTMNKMMMWKLFRFNIIFIGDDWFNSGRYQEAEKMFSEVGVTIMYFPYTRGTSFSLISNIILHLNN